MQADIRRLCQQDLHTEEMAHASAICPQEVVGRGCLSIIMQQCHCEDSFTAGSTETHFGRPASMASSASIMDAPGSFSDGFRTKVLPVVQAMGNIHRGIMAGKLKGQMPAHTCTAHSSQHADLPAPEPP